MYLSNSAAQTQTDIQECELASGGGNYSGNVSHTVSGRTCQKWTSQNPHEHSYTPDKFPSSGLGDHNYCRNVNGSSFTAWCYTTDSQKRWEYCPVGPFDICVTEVTSGKYEDFK